MTLLDMLVIGHISKDLTPAGYSPGGTVTYAGITARNLGFRTGILTRAGNDVATATVYDGIAMHRLSSKQTTTFENIYSGSQRTQYLHTRAGQIVVDDVPTGWRGARAVLLGPIAGEFTPDLARVFSSPLVGAVLQGWMRVWDQTGRISNKPEMIRSMPLDTMQVVFLSEEDLAGHRGLLDWLVMQGPLVVLTSGRRGCAVYQGENVHHIGPRAAREVDPTGAGDVFAAAFLLRLSEGLDVLDAARFANIVASFSVEQAGTSGIPNRDQVRGWMAQHASPAALPKRNTSCTLISK